MHPTISPILLSFLVLLLAGCVSKSNYLEKVDELNRLEETAYNLRTEGAQLKEDKRALQTANEDLDRQLTEALARSAALQQDLVRARTDLDRLELVLSTRSAEAGSAMAEMRRQIDQLQDENRELAARLETERLAREARLAQMQSTYNELVQKMETEIERGEITISELQGRLTVNMVERILFDSGKADLKPAAAEVLLRIGEIIKGEEDKEIRVEGHTDNIPISPRLRQIFPSNWELSTARAANVLHFLQERGGIPGERLSACGFGEYRPIADNLTPEGRAQNRRIQIVLVPMEGQVVKPLE